MLQVGYVAASHLKQLLEAHRETVACKRERQGGQLREGVRFA